MLMIVIVFAGGANFAFLRADNSCMREVQSVRGTWFWKIELFGRIVFTVRSAYHLGMTNFIDTSHLQEPGDWLLIRKLKVPPRIMIFLWRACRGCLPTRIMFGRKGDFFI